MSNRRRPLLAIVLVTLVVVGATAAAATAEEVPHYIKGGVEVTTQTTVTSNVVSFFIYTPFDAMLVLCTGIKSSGSIGAKWKSKITIEFTGCMVAHPENCTINPEIKLLLLDQLVYKGGHKGEELRDVLFSEKSPKFTGGTFAQIKFEGELCPLLGTQAVTGSAIALMSPNTSGTEAEVVKLGFDGLEGPLATYENQGNKTAEAAGKLLFTGKPAYLFGEIKFELAGGFGAS